MRQQLRYRLIFHRSWYCDLLFRTSV